MCRQGGGDVGGAGLAVAAEGEVAQGAITAGPLPAQIWQWSSAKVTSRIQCSLFSIDQRSRMISVNWSERMSPKPRSVTA